MKENGIKGIASHLATMGRYGDDLLVHMNKGEKGFLEHLTGQPMTMNPATGLPEAFSLWKTLLGVGLIAAAPFTGGISAAIGIPLATGTAAALGAGIGALGASTAASGIMSPSGSVTTPAEQLAQYEAQRKAQAQNFVNVPVVNAVESPLPIQKGLPGTVPEQPQPMQQRWTGQNIGLGPGYKFAPGGIVDPAMAQQQAPAQGQDPKAIIAGAIEAIEGQSRDPQAALKAFVALFGQQELQDLISAVKQQGVGMRGEPQPGMAPGGALHSPTSGMRDDIPASVNGRQNVRLSGGEFVVPADVVAHLGDGNSDAGSQALYSMMDRVRQRKTGKTKQPGRINPAAMLPA